MTVPPARYSVEWSSPAKRALGRLPEKTALAAIEFIYGPLGEMPQRVGHPLRLEFEGLHSARRGDYSIVYRIDEPRRRVTIEAIGHRADIYRRRSVAGHDLPANMGRPTPPIRPRRRKS